MAPLLRVNPLDLILNTLPAHLNLSSRFIVVNAERELKQFPHFAC